MSSWPDKDTCHEIYLISITQLINWHTVRSSMYKTDVHALIYGFPVNTKDPNKMSGRNFAVQVKRGLTTVKPVLSGHSKVLKTNGSLMKVKSIAECSAILLTCIKRYSVLKTNFWSSF